MATTATPWIRYGDDKLYLQSGQFTATLKTSQAVGTVETAPQGVSWDSTDTPWGGTTTQKLYITSGQFAPASKLIRAPLDAKIKSWL